MLPMSEGSYVLDIGSDLGILAFELAANLCLHIQAIDIDPRFVGHSIELLGRLDEQDLFVDGATSNFVTATFGICRSTTTVSTLPSYGNSCSSYPILCGARRTPSGGPARRIRLCERYRRPVTHDLAGTQPLAGPARGRRLRHPIFEGRRPPVWKKALDLPTPGGF